jgi:sugar phosphate isomerase/epimerase
MLLSLSGFLFEDNYHTTSLSMESFLTLARNAGYSGVELRETQVNLRTSSQDRKDILRLINDAGLVVTCLTARGLPAAGAERDTFFQQYLDLCRDLECALLKISSDPDWLRWAAQKAEECQVVLATNNHIGGMLETVDGTRKYFSEIGHRNFGLLYDSLHLMVSDQDYLGCIEEFRNMTQNILIHSVRPVKPGEKPAIEKNGQGWIHALTDEPGVQDWREIFRRFKQRGYDGLITVIENGWPTDRRKYVAGYYAEAIKRLWNEVEKI